MVRIHPGALKTDGDSPSVSEAVLNKGVNGIDLGGEAKGSGIPITANTNYSLADVLFENVQTKSLAEQLFSVAEKVSVSL